MTQRQTEANRENAKKSAGLRTKSGRASSSQNSIKHGLNQALGLEHGNPFIILLRLVNEDGHSHDEDYSIISAILDHCRVMEACYEQYHAPKDVFGRAEVMMMQDFECDAEMGLLKIGYNDTVKIAKFKARVERINERLGSAQVQRINERLGSA